MIEAQRRAWVARSVVGSSLALSASGKMPRAMRATASWPSTSNFIIACALGGVVGASGNELRLANCAQLPGAG